jgi:LacI family transcriptional regulator
MAEAAAYSEDAGYVAATRLLDVAPTAIFAANDLLALGALRAARERGVRVPADLSLVGINDIPMVALLDPPLTTARVPQREMGAIAARILINLLEHEPVQERHVRLEAELVVRGSTGAPRAAGRRVA